MILLQSYCRCNLPHEEQRLRIWQLFVKEIEYDGDNLEELEWQLETNAAFSPAALCAYFESVGGA